MITRIVKMTFKSDSIESFKDLFVQVSPNINKFKGCSGVQLFQDHTDHRVFFTFSTWEDENALQSYRQSSFFKDTWQKTKQLFEEPAQAWSTQIVLK